MMDGYVGGWLDMIDGWLYGWMYMMDRWMVRYDGWMNG